MHAGIERNLNGEPLAKRTQKRGIVRIDHALREVQSWDLALAADLPDLARLRVVLSDARRALLADPAPRG